MTKRFVAHCHVLAVLLALVALVGCQGLSSGGSKSQTPQPQNAVLGLSGSSLNFGTVTMGNSKTLSVTAENTGTASLTITSAQSSSTEFVLSKPALPLTIAAGATATLSVTFKPSSTAAASGTIAIASNSSDGAMGLGVEGDGSAPGVLGVSPASLAFGSVLEGNSQKRPGNHHQQRRK